MSTSRVQHGRRITADPGATILSGAPVVIGNLVCIALVDGVTGTEMEFAVGEVHNIPKVDAAVIAQGERVIFDVSAGADGEVDDEIATPAAGDVSNFGVAWEGTGATTGENIAVLLTAGTGTVT